MSFCHCQFSHHIISSVVAHNIAYFADILPPPTTIIASMSSSPLSSPSPRHLRCGEWVLVGSPKKNKPCIHDNGSRKLHCDDNGTRKHSSNHNSVTWSDSSSSCCVGDPRRISASPEEIIHQATIKNASFLFHPLTHPHSPDGF